MSKRKWRDSGLDDLGVSESLLRDLDKVERIKDDLRGVGDALNRRADVRWSNLDAGIRSAAEDLDARIRSVDALVPNTFETLDARMAGARTALDRVNAGLQGNSLRDIAARIRVLPVGNLTNPAQSSSLVSSIIKATDRLNDIARPQPPGLLSGALGIEPGWSAAKTASSPFGISQQQSALIKGWHSGFVAKDWQSAFEMKRSASIFGFATASPGWSTALLAKEHRMLEVMRRIDVTGAGLNDFMNRMMPAMNVIGHHMSRVFRAIEQIDWETLVESWRVQEARRPRTKVGFAALKAYDAFYLNRPWVVDGFLIDYLAIKPSDETREALWIVLREAFERTIPEPATWITLDDKKATTYLRVAVYNEAWRVRRDQEMEDRIWWLEGEKEEDEEGRKLSEPNLSSNNNLDFIVRKSPSPEKPLIPPLDPRGQVLELLYFEGTAQDKKIVEMLIAGLDLPAIAEVVGWPEVQRFLRKARRWMTLKL